MRCVRVRHSAELARVREQALASQQELQQRLDAQLHDMQSDSKQQVCARSTVHRDERRFPHVTPVQMAAMARRAEELGQRNAELTESKHTLETRLQQAQSSLQLAQEELAALKVR